MPDYKEYYRDRASRSRASRRGGEAQDDTLTVMLTIQVVVVLLLIVAVWILKLNNPGAYERFRVSYRTMATDAESFRETWDTYGSKLKKLLDSLPFIGEPGEQSAPPESRTADTGKPEGEEHTLPAFDYDYLGPQDGPSLVARGGMNLMTLAAGTDLGEQLLPPTDAVLSPVVLSAVLKPPVTGVVTSPFSWRYHPITETTDFHNGIDIAAEEGRAILAALPGEVEEVGNSQIYGNYIILRHATNLQTFYAHCSEVIAEEGMAVRQGERIAKVGQTGVATGPHLHFSVIVEGVYTDPRWVLEDFIELVD